MTPNIANRESELRVRLAQHGDLTRLTEIYNHYIVNTPITFDIEPYSVEKRAAWFDQFAPTGRHRLLVAEDAGNVVGYVGTMRFRPKAAYDTTWKRRSTAIHGRRAAGLAAGSWTNTERP